MTIRIAWSIAIVAAAVLLVVVTLLVDDQSGMLIIGFGGIVVAGLLLAYFPKHTILVCVGLMIYIVIEALVRITTCRSLITSIKPDPLFAITEIAS
jgi:hypothetical protein